MFGDDFMDFIGYRESLIDEAVEEAEEDGEFDRGDLTDDEVKEVYNRLNRR